MIIGVGSLKGGVGKSLSAVHLAAVAAEGGARVVLVDADPEGSARRWAAHAGGDLPFEVRAEDGDAAVLAATCRELAAGGVAVLVDLPPNDRARLEAVAEVATAVVVPCPGTGLDVDRLRPTLERLGRVEAERGRPLPVGVLLTRIDPRRRLAREAAEALAAVGWPTFETRIGERVAYARAFGSAPTHLDEYRRAWAEVVEATR